MGRALGLSTRALEDGTFTSPVTRAASWGLRYRSSTVPCFSILSESLRGASVSAYSQTLLLRFRLRGVRCENIVFQDVF